MLDDVTERLLDSTGHLSIIASGDSSFSLRSGKGSCCRFLPLRFVLRFFFYAVFLLLFIIVPSTYIYNIDVPSVPF